MNNMHISPNYISKKIRYPKLSNLTSIHKKRHCLGERMRGRGGGGEAAAENVSNNVSVEMEKAIIRGLHLFYYYSFIHTVKFLHGAE